METVFLFGAGASAFSDIKRIYPALPPTGPELFKALENARLVPQSIAHYDRKAFKKNFEEGMYLLNERGSQAYNPMQKNLAIYFSRFMAGKDNLYTKLIQGIKGKLDKVTFSTLNYDMLLETAAGINNILTVDYHTRNDSKFRILKIHGACNIFPNLDPDTFKNCRFKGFKCDINSNKVIVASNPEEVQELCTKYDNSFSPAMSMYMKGKRNPSCSGWIENQQIMWAEELHKASVCYIIGVRFVAEDDHIWEPLARFHGIIKYVDPFPEAFLEWSKQNNRQDVSFSKTFKEALPLIIKEVNGA